MKLKIFITVFTAMFLWNCSSDEPMVNITAQETEMQTSPSSRYLSPEEAIQAAIKGFKDYGFDQVSSRSGRNADVYIYSDVQSRVSEIPDSLFYIVNVDGGGFAVVTAERKFDGYIVGISDQSYFDENNQNLTFYMSLLSEMYGITNINIPKPITPFPIKPGGGGPWGAIDPIGGGQEQYPETSYSDNYGQILPTQWRQESPYNKFCPELSTWQISQLTEYGKSVMNGHCAVGCVPIAIGQIAAYYKYPASINGYTMDWDAILKNSVIEYVDNSAQDQIAHLVREIGRKVNASYGISTGARYDDAYYGCRNIGFNGVVKTASLSTCYESIINGNPVAVFGLDKDRQNGHCWVADAYIKTTYKRYSESKKDYIVTRYGHKLHFNWGWGGVSDGYFDTTDSFKTDNVEYDQTTLQFLVNFL